MIQLLRLLKSLEVSSEMRFRRERQKHKNSSIETLPERIPAKIREPQEFSARVTAQVHFNHCRVWRNVLSETFSLLLIDSAAWLSLTIIKHLHVRNRRDSVTAAVSACVALRHPCQAVLWTSFMMCHQHR